MSADPHLLTDIAALEALYGVPGAASIAKEVPYLTEDYRAFVAAAPFCALATVGPEGADVSPRGDGPGFVAVDSPTRLLLPDRRGNNRADSLRNIIRDPRVALLFLIPGIGETLRINGRGSVSIAPDLLSRFTVNGKAPRSVLIIDIETVFFQCSRALVRSDLWNPDKHLPRSSLPSTGAILANLTAEIDGNTYDRDLSDRVTATLY
jgi:PPOX class probable FMN-dependent enzyme